MCAQNVWKKNKNTYLCGRKAAKPPRYHIRD